MTPSALAPLSTQRTCTLPAKINLHLGHFLKNLIFYQMECIPDKTIAFSEFLLIDILPLSFRFFQKWPTITISEKPNTCNCPVLQSFLKGMHPLSCLSSKPRWWHDCAHAACLLFNWAVASRADWTTWLLPSPMFWATPFICPQHLHPLHFICDGAIASLLYIRWALPAVWQSPDLLCQPHKGLERK